MTKLSSFQVDPEELERGTWYDFEDDEILDGDEPHESHLCFLLLPLNNTRAEAAKRIRRRGFRPGVDDIKMMDEVEIKAMAAAAVIGWANLDDDDGSPIRYSPQKCEEILRDPKNQRVVDILRSVCDELASRAAADLDDARGN